MQNNRNKKLTSQAHAASQVNVKPTTKATTPQNVNPIGLNEKDYIKYLTDQLNEKNDQVEFLKSQQKAGYNYETGKPIQGDSSPGSVHGIKVFFFEGNQSIGDCTALDYPSGLWLNIHELSPSVIDFVKNKAQSVSTSKAFSLNRLIVDYSTESILSIPNHVLKQLFEKNMLIKNNGVPCYVHTYISLTKKLNLIWDAFTCKESATDKDAYYSMPALTEIQTFLGFIVIDVLGREVSDQDFHKLAKECDFMNSDIKEMVSDLQRDYMQISKELAKCVSDLLPECMESLGYLDNLYSFYQDCNNYLLTQNK